MNHRTAMFLSLWAMFGLGLVATAAEPEALATEDELKQLLAAGQFQPVVAKSTRILQLKGEAAKAYDRARVQMLKGEAHLRLKQNTPALEAFANAAKEAKDPKEAALAASTELLVRKSSGGKYSVKPSGGGKPESLDILDPEQRKKAFAALYADEVNATAPKLKAAGKATALPPIVDAIKASQRLKALELTAEGKDEKTLASVKDLGGRAEVLMRGALDGLNVMVQEVSRSANTPERSIAADGTSTTKPRGLDPQQTRRLRDAVSTCRQVATGATEMATATAVTTLAAVSKDAERIGTDAQKLLDTDWDPLKNKRGGTATGAGTGVGTPRRGYGGR